MPYPHVSWPVVTFSLISLLGAFAFGLYLLWFLAAIWGGTWFVIGTLILFVEDARVSPGKIKFLGASFTWKFLPLVVVLAALLAGSCTANILTFPEVCQGDQDAC